MRHDEGNRSQDSSDHAAEGFAPSGQIDQGRGGPFIHADDRAAEGVRLKVPIAVLLFSIACTLVSRLPHLPKARRIRPQTAEDAAEHIRLTKAPIVLSP